jgi:hypothetical protein
VTPMRRLALASLFVSLALAASATAAQAWGLKGHTIVGQAAVARLPDALPSFVRADWAKAEIVYLQDEEDRLKLGEGDEDAWAREWTTDHYVDIGDDGTIGGAVPIAALPTTRDDFIQRLARATPRVDAYSVGFLPYAILEGYEQVRTDFALWRSAAPDEKSEREHIAIHDIGIFSHFVGDGSQPLHVSVHYNGWGAYPNPEGFTESKGTHADFEGAFVDKYLSADDVTPLVGAARTFAAIPLAEIERYLEATDAQVVPFYELQKSGAFALDGASSDAHAKGVAFAASRLAAGSEMLDSLILTAWETSAGMKPEG